MYCSYLCVSVKKIYVSCYSKHLLRHIYWDTLDLTIISKYTYSVFLNVKEASERLSPDLKEAVWYLLTPFKYVYPLKFNHNKLKVFLSNDLQPLSEY